MNYGPLSVSPVAARFIGLSSQGSPRTGARGMAFPICHPDEAMAEANMPWMFFPDRDERGYYVMLDEIEFQTAAA